MFPPNLWSTHFLSSPLRFHSNQCRSCCLRWWLVSPSRYILVQSSDYMISWCWSHDVIWLSYPVVLVLVFLVNIFWFYSNNAKEFICNERKCQKKYAISPPLLNTFYGNVLTYGEDLGEGSSTIMVRTEYWNSRK